MYKKLFFIILFIAVILMACNKKDEFVGQPSSDLIGNWISPQYSDTIVTYQKSDILHANDYGMSLQTENKMMERKNAGWCGTPPISYADFDGSWSVSDSIISISVAYWGGTADYKWKIVSLDSDKLSVIILDQVFYE